jgi:hypothetical protein
MLRSLTSSGAVPPRSFLSILRFIEGNWGLGTIGDPQSFDVLASGTILGMFDFNLQDSQGNRQLILDPTTGQVLGGEQ